MKDYQRAVAIDYSILAQAEAFYSAKGYRKIATPWVISEEPYFHTKPEEAIPYATLGGFLVASAEQAFLAMMLKGEKIGKAQTTTPCFRDEEHDATHHPYFMKTELINTVTVNEKELALTVENAQEFLNCFLKTEVLAFPDNTIDIVASSSGIELGSYGIRTHKNYSWIYGTGVALPRLTEAMAHS